MNFYTYCYLYVRDTLEIEQYKELGKILQPWDNSQPNSAGCTHTIGFKCLDDLLAGGPPKPDFLQMTEFIRSVNEKEEGALAAMMEPDYMEGMKQALDNGRRRIIHIATKHPPECNYESCKCGYFEAIRGLMTTVHKKGLLNSLRIRKLPPPEGGCECSYVPA